MSKNPKVTIALAFVLTFLIGIGSGYLLRGSIQSPVAGEQVIHRNMIPGDRSAGERDRREQREREPDRTTADDASGSQERYRDDDKGEDRPGWSHGRLKNRLAKDLNLSDEKVDELFSILENHREMGKELFIEYRETFHENLEQLQEQLEADLSEILNDEQMEIWRENYSPKDGRLHRRQSDQRER